MVGVGGDTLASLTMGWVHVCGSTSSCEYFETLRGARLQEVAKARSDMEPELPPPRPDLVLEPLDLLGGQTPSTPSLPSSARTWNISHWPAGDQE